MESQRSASCQHLPTLLPNSSGCPMRLTTRRPTMVKLEGRWNIKALG